VDTYFFEVVSEAAREEDGEEDADGWSVILYRQNLESIPLDWIRILAPEVRR
jgi:hypothetical protein